MKKTTGRKLALSRVTIAHLAQTSGGDNASLGLACPPPEQSTAAPCGPTKWTCPPKDYTRGYTCTVISCVCTDGCDDKP